MEDVDPTDKQVAYVELGGRRRPGSTCRESSGWDFVTG